MQQIFGRVPVELGVLAAHAIFSAVLGRDVGLIEAKGREIADRLLELTEEVYRKYLHPTATDAGQALKLSGREGKQRLLAAHAFFLGVAVLESLYGVDTIARWIVGDLAGEGLSA